MSVTDKTRAVYHGQPEMHRDTLPSAVVVTNPGTRAATLANMRKIWVGDPTIDGQALPTTPTLATSPSVSMSILIDNLNAQANLYIAFPRYHAGNLAEETAVDAAAGYVFAAAEFIAGRFKTVGAGAVFVIDCAVPYFLIGTDTEGGSYEISIVHEETPSITAL